MRSVLLILSASSCNPELQVEFGTELPACAVPLGPRTLFNLQVERSFQSDKNLVRVFVAIPEGAQLDAGSYAEVVNCSTKGVASTFRVLMHHVVKWMERVDNVEDDPRGWRVHVLHGDTLINDILAFSEPHLLMAPRSSPLDWNKEQSLRYSSEIFTGKITFYHKSTDPIPPYTELVERLPRKVTTPDNWLDFGHLSTYYQSKRQVLVSRAFNNIQLTPAGFVTKRGQPSKIKAEFAWYLEIPDGVAMYTPRVSKSQDPYDSYTLEYLPFPTLAELLVHGNHSLEFWKHIMEKIKVLLSEMSSSGMWHRIHDGLLLEKSRERCLSLDPVRKANALELIEFLRSFSDAAPSVVHGDLCFSNILYDLRSDSLKIIDPRGIDSTGRQVIHGSQLYDLAKLYHSAMGYDFAVANRGHHDHSEQSCILIASKVLEIAQERWYIEPNVIVAATSLLFYSMLPLHKEDLDRVNRLTKIADQLYKAFKQ